MRESNRSIARLRNFFTPERIAVVGANEGNGFVRNLVASAHDPDFTLVNLSAREILGHQSVSSLSEAPSPIDLAVISVPASHVVDAVVEGAEHGIRNYILHAAGFEEAGPRGKDRQKRLVEFAEANDILFLGPNCLGFSNYLSGAPLHGATLPALLEPGSVGMIAQSGSASIVMMNSARTFDFSYVITTGNEACLTSEDALQFLIEDDATQVILMFVESARQGRRFLTLARRAALVGKPIIVLKVGRSTAGKRVAMSHTGAMAGEEVTYSTALEALDVIQVYDFDEMVQTANLLAAHGSSAITRPAVLGISGGELGLAADVAQDVCLDLPQFDQRTRTEIARLMGLHDHTAITNPFDLGNGYSPKTFKETFRALFRVIEADPNIDGLVLLQDAQESLQEGYLGFYRTVTEIFAEHVNASKRPAIHVSNLAEPMSSRIIEPLETAGVISVSGLRTGLQGVKNAASFACAQERSAFSTPMESQRSVELRKALEAGLGERVRGTEYVPEFEALSLLAELGMPVVPEVTAATAMDAMKAARDLGFPTVLKVWSDEVVHKASAGGVALGLRSAREVERAFHEVTSAVEDSHPGSVWGVIIAPQVNGVLEAILGSIHDEQFGTFILLGLGGSFVEQLGQTTLILPPESVEDAEKAIYRSPLAPILHHLAIPVSTLASTVHQFGQIAVASEGILSEFEINPLIITASGEQWAVDARMKCR